MKKVFAILDVKANYFLKPFCEDSSVQALRGFEVASNESGSTFNRFPDDFALCELGEFDDSCGLLIPHGNPLNLGSARTVIRSSPISEVRQ